MAQDKIIRMANQIAAFMQSKPEAEALAGFAAHLNDFWAPQLRAQFFDCLAQGAEMHPLAAKAAALVRRPSALRAAD